MLFKKKKLSEEELAELENELLDEDFEDNLEEIPENEPTAVTPGSEVEPSSEPEEAVAEPEEKPVMEIVPSSDEDSDEDEYEDEDEDNNDADDEEERYLLSLVRRQRAKKYSVIIIAGIIVACLLVFGLVYLLTHKDPNATAVKVGDTSIPLSEFAFSYWYGIDFFYNNYGSSLSSYGVDLSGDLSESTCLIDSSMTWEEYFILSAAELLQQNEALYEEAEKAGYTVTDEDVATVESYVSSMSEYADAYGISLEEFITQCYGQYVDETVLMKCLLRMSVAQRYQDDITDDLDITDDAIEEYYQENIDTYRTAKYRMMIFSDAKLDEDAGGTAEELANEMAEQVKSEADFIRLSKEYAPSASATYYEDDDYTLAEGIVLANFSSEAECAEWIFDDARQEGDVTVLETQSGYAVTYFIEFGRDTSRNVDVRHILIQPEDSEDEESVAAAKEEAERIYKEWLNGEKTEESFAALAAEYTADSNGSDGGLYTGVYEGQMVEAFNDWCFDESREPGDSGIVETEYGFHIMYFVQRDEENWKASIRSILQSDAFSSYYTAMLENYPYSIVEKNCSGLKR